MTNGLLYLGAISWINTITMHMWLTIQKTENTTNKNGDKF